MRPYAIGGTILVILGVVMLSIHSITYFTTETQTGPLGFFAWDVSRPNTIYMNPIAGVVAIAVGVGLVLMTRRHVTS